MRSISSAKLLIVFAVALSLASLPGPLSLNAGLIPSFHLAHANTAVNEPWYPAGPSMDTLTYPIFTDESAEFTALQASTLDFTDWPLDPSLITTCPGTGINCSTSFLVTNPISDSGYFELQFHQGNNFFGCLFQEGNPAVTNSTTGTDAGSGGCGVEIRQAFAHGLDKNIFVNVELGGNAVVIDNPVPPSTQLAVCVAQTPATTCGTGVLTSSIPDPCGWDTLGPWNGASGGAQVGGNPTGSQCVVGSAGGTAYHLATATAGSGCTNTPGFTYTPGCGTPDFCAAAQHLINAGLATGRNPTTCVLTGIQNAVWQNPIQVYVRSDNTPRLHSGNSYAQFMCALFTGSFSTGCSFASGQNGCVPTAPATTCPVVNATPGPITAFPGFTTSTSTVSLSWWVYTAGFGNVLTFDSSLFFGYNSQFVSGVSSIRQSSPTDTTHPCSFQSVPSFAPGNYMYICNKTFDKYINQAEFAPALASVNSPKPGQTFHGAGATITFGTGTTDATTGAYLAEDNYGRNAYSIPWWSGKDQFAYRNGWLRGILNKADGYTPPGNFFTTLNAYQNPAPVAGTIRQGYKQSTGSSNPFIGSTVWDAGVIGSIYDAPGTTNPDSPQSYMDWMTVKTDQLSASSLSYAAPAGTVAAFRYTLRSDIFWHTGQRVTAWDLAFSYTAYRFAGVGGGLAPVIGIKVLSPTQVDLDVNNIGQFTKLFLSNTVIPGRDWSATCSPTTWDAGANNPVFASANAALNACIAPSTSISGSGVIIPDTTGAWHSNVDPAKIQPSFDPVTSANSILVGSGPWVCQTGTTIGQGCSSSGNSAPPVGGSWTFQRYGKGTTPGGSLNTYFRSAGNLALWVWSQDRGVFSQDFLNFGVISLCFGKPLGTSGCTVWQHGIGNTAGTTIGVPQVSIVQRFVGVNWVQPFDWISSPPQNIASFPPVLYEGLVTLNPCSIDPVNGYDC